MLRLICEGNNFTVQIRNQDNVFNISTSLYESIKEGILPDKDIDTLKTFLSMKPNKEFADNVQFTTLTDRLVCRINKVKILDLSDDKNIEKLIIYYNRGVVESKPSKGCSQGAGNLIFIKKDNTDNTFVKIKGGSLFRIGGELYNTCIGNLFKDSEYSLIEKAISLGNKEEFVRTLEFGNLDGSISFKTDVESDFMELTPGTLVLLEDYYNDCLEEL